MAVTVLLEIFDDLTDRIGVSILVLMAVTVLLFGGLFITFSNQVSILVLMAVTVLQENHANAS